MNKKLSLVLANSIAEADIIISTVYGNEHNVLGLVNHPRPFDFILNNSCNNNLSVQSEFVKKSYVEDALVSRTRPNEILLEKLRQIAGSAKPIFHLQSPPPIPSEDHIFKYPEKYGPRLKERGVAPKCLRLKLWKLFSQIIHNYCDQSNIDFVPNPTSVEDSEGFLKEMYWAEDATHGNKQYGTQVLDNLLSKIFKLEKQI